MKNEDGAPTREALATCGGLETVKDFRLGVQLREDVAAKLREALRSWEMRGGFDPAGRFGVGRQALLRAAAGLRVKKANARMIELGLVGLGLLELKDGA